MTTKGDITFRFGENWQILFVAHDADNNIMPLPSGTNVLFTMVPLSSEQPIITKEVGAGITITNEAGGEATITIQEEDYLAVGIKPGAMCNYEIKVVTASATSIQAEGRFIVLASLFADEKFPLLRMFRMRFPEFSSKDDELVLMFIEDAQEIIDEDGDAWNEKTKPKAVVTLAAHLAFIQKTGGELFNSGGAAIGAVKSIRVEDKTVMYETGGNTTTLKATIKDTAYGLQYLSMLRRQVRFIQRA